MSLSSETRHWGMTGGPVNKESACNARDPGSIPRLERSPRERNGYPLWRRKRHPTPVFLPGESHGQRSLAGYSAWWATVHGGL